MIGSFEFDNQTISDNIFIPLIDGSLIRFDKEGYLEVSFFLFNLIKKRTTFNVKDQNFAEFFNS